MKNLLATLIKFLQLRLFIYFLIFISIFCFVVWGKCKIEISFVTFFGSNKLMYYFSTPTITLDDRQNACVRIKEKEWVEIVKKKPIYFTSNLENTKPWSIFLLKNFHSHMTKRRLPFKSVQVNFSIGRKIPSWLQ